MMKTNRNIIPDCFLMIQNHLYIFIEQNHPQLKPILSLIYRHYIASVRLSKYDFHFRDDFIDFWLWVPLT